MRWKITNLRPPLNTYLVRMPAKFSALLKLEGLDAAMNFWVRELECRGAQPQTERPQL